MVLVLAGVAIAAWLALRAYGPLLARERLEAGLAQALDRPVRIERVILRPWLGRLTLEAVRVAAGPGPDAGPMLRLGRAQVTLGISSLWRREIVLSRILLEDGDLRLVASDGAAAQPPPLLPERIEAGPLVFRIRLVQLRRTRIAYDDPAGARRLDIEGLDASVRPGGGGTDLTVRADGVRLRAPGVAEALERIEAEGRVLPDLLTIRRATARWQGREVSLGGEVRQPFGAPDLALALRGEVDLARLAPRAGLAWPVTGVARAEADVQGGLEAPRVSARVAIPELTAGPVTARQVALRGQWADGTLRLTEVAARVFGGELEASAALAPARPAESRATVRLHDVSLAALEALAPTPLGLQGTLSLEADLGGDPQRLEGVRGRVALDASGIRLPGALQRAGAGTVRAEVRFRDAAAELTSMAAQWPGVRIAVAGRLGLEGPQGLRLGLEADLGALGLAWGVEQIAGRAALEAEANGSWTRPEVAGRVRAAAPTVLETRLDRVEVPFHLRASTLRVDDAGASLGESRFTASGTARWGGGNGGVEALARPDPEVRLEVRAPSLRLEDLERWVPPAWRGTGRLALSAAVEGTPTAWRATGSVAGDRLVAPRQIPLEDLRAAFTVGPERVEIATLRARVHGIPVRAEGAWAWEGTGRASADLGPADVGTIPGVPAALALRGTGRGRLEGEVRSGDVTASGRFLLEQAGAVGLALGAGAIQVALGGGQMQAELAFPAAGLSARAEGPVDRSGPIAGQVLARDLPVGSLLRYFRGPQGPEVEGALTAHARFTVPPGDPLAGRATLRLEPARLVVAGEAWAIPDPVTLRWEARALRLEALRLEGRLGNLTAAGAMDAAGALAATVRGRINLAILPTLRPEIRTAAGVLELDATIGGTAATPTLEGGGSIADASLALRDFPEPLRGITARLRLAESSIRLVEAEASLGEETIRARGEFTLRGREAVAADVTLEGLPVRPIARHFLAGVEGELVDLEGAVSARARFTIPLADPGAARGTVALHPVRLVVAGEAWASREPVAIRWEPGVLHVDRLSLHGPAANVTASGVVGLPGTLDLTVQGELPLGLLPALRPEVREAKGSLWAAATLAGTSAAPALSGEGRITQGMLQLRDYPDALRDLEARFVLSPNGVRLDEAVAALGRGRIRAEGELALNGWAIGPYRFTVAGRDVPLAPVEGLQTAWDLDLEMVGQAGQALLSGEGRLRRGSYTRNLTLISLLMGEGGGAAAGAAPPIHLQVLLKFENPLMVQTPLARLRIEGAVSLEGTAAAPALFGTLEAREGQIVFRKHRFTLASAAARFADPRRIDPILDVVATARIRAFDVTVHLSGRAEDLDVRLSSTPPLPQEDLLALVAFGATREELGRSAAGILASEAAQILVKEVLGVESSGAGLGVFEVENTGDGGGTLLVGKDLTEDLRVLYSQGLSRSGGSKLRVEYKILGPLLVAGEQGLDGNSGADVVLRLRFR